VVALYKYAQVLQQNNHAAFDTVSPANTPAPFPGIYQCPGCGHTIAIAGGHNLPPQNHHQHTPAQGVVRWQLIVAHD